MASGFFALLDDIAALMDDVVVMTKISTKKTAGILGDDLAVNAEKATGFVSSRELPVLWAITKGSALNKLIILPIAFLLSAFVPIGITIALVLGGVYLAYEGVEKIYQYFFHPKPKKEIKSVGREIKNLPKEAVLENEKSKIKSAIFTDFILSVEIIIIALGTVIGKPILFQILVVSLVSVIATIGVYGIVALIVRMDDFGLKLVNISENGISFWFGNLLIKTLPIIIKSLSIIGTIALLLVAGGIFIHNVKIIHHITNPINLPVILKEFLVGIIIGLMALILVKGITFILKTIKG
ncbi:DUF808 domain-containing protein [Litoribaculum gwangyangense]|uniref:DUF808 domain-containing protein n=1 Tax=Litoribaculum gwangyangense TaxID=1130722 RepID=A0ABP9CQE9_9FLAO